MQRRHALIGATAGVLSCLSGCTAVDLPRITARSRHPFADTTLGVRIENRGSTSHDVEENAREALGFWAAESGRYAGFDVAFEFVDENPDIVMAYVDSSEHCSDVENYSRDVLGCAPLIRPENRVSTPVTAYVVAADRPFGSVLTTAKHEIGHVLGLGHDAEPRAIMSNDPADRIPRYDVRVDIWETVLTGYERAGTATEQLNDGIDHWNADRYRDAIDTFESARRGFSEARGTYRIAQDLTADLDAEPPLETVNYEQLDAALSRLLGRMAAASDVARAMGEASQAAADGEGSTSRRLASEANDRLAEYRALGPVESRDIAVALGLVRGYDREDVGVTVGSDEL